MLNRVRRPGATGSEGEKATNSPRSTLSAQRLRFDAQWPAVGRNRRPASNLALGIIVGQGTFFKRPPGTVSVSHSPTFVENFLPRT